MAHATSIIPYYSTTTTNVPASSSLAAGEIAWNVTDKKIFSSTNGTDIVTIFDPASFQAAGTYLSNLSEDSTPSLGGNLAGGDYEVSAVELVDVAEVVNAIGSIGGGTQDIDLTLGGVVTGTVDTSATTFTFSNPWPSGSASSFTLILTNGGSQTVTWPASVSWPGGTAPTLTAAGVDILVFLTVDGGTTWHGTFASEDSQ
jgi:hypothetical protein